jgi:hypothetical protein
LLSNIQFVESRVYDDDDGEIPETAKVVEPTEEQNLSQEQKDANFRTEIASALVAGANFIQSAFDKVEVCFNVDIDLHNELIFLFFFQFDQSDSEDDEIQELEPIYESRNAYHARKLPCIIGTQSFLVTYFLSLFLIKYLLFETTEYFTE